jgi:uncharacterized membrane protein YgdD (TMEM256/DUF423 family)
MQARTQLMLAAISGFLTVALGAFGAHGLKGRIDPELLTVFHTGVDYQGLHSLALLGCGLWSLLRPARALGVAAWAFVIGTLLFSGSLYLMAFTGLRWLGAITPFGGIAFLVGWASLAVAAYRLPRVSR